MRRSSLRGLGLLATTALLLSACGDDAAVDGDDTGAEAPNDEATDATGVSGTPGADGGGIHWAAGLETDCENYKAVATANTEPLFASESGPDPEQVRQLFLGLTPTVVKIRSDVAAAAAPDEIAADRDAWLTELDAQIVMFEAAGADAEVAMSTLEELSGPFTGAAGAAADAVGVYACGSGTTFAEAELSDEARAAAARVGVTAVDYGFEVGTEVVAGDTVVEFHNGGGEEHEVILFRIADGTTYDEALAFLEENLESDEEPAFMEGFHGGFAGPGGRTEVAVTFEAGTWMMICFIPAADEEPHFLKGMHREITVA